MSSLYRLVREHFNSSLRQQNKEFGIEIEVENVPGLHIPGGIWETTGDDSLGNDTSNGELVLSSPLNFKEAMAAIRVADRHLKEHHPDHHFSMRTSVHVHMNVQQYSLKQILDILTLYWLYENQLVRYCGPDREGNFYCLRFSDAEALAYKVYAACLYLQNGDELRALDLLPQTEHKYSAVNTVPSTRVPTTPLATSKKQCDASASILSDRYRATQFFSAFLTYKLTVYRIGAASLVLFWFVPVLPAFPLLSM